MRMIHIVVGVLLASTAQAAEKNLSFAEIAAGLSIPLESGDCRYGQKELANRESDRLQAGERSFRQDDTYGPDWACVMLKRHLKRDAGPKCSPAPEQALAYVPASKITVEGKMKYLGFIKQPYRYDVEPTEDGHARVTVRIRFTDEPSTDAAAMEDIRAKLAYASQLWSSKSPGQAIEFRFVAVDESGDPHFTVKLERKDRATRYNKHWSTQDSKIIISHEVGHMLGLDDEYAILRSIFWEIKDDADTRRCNLRGLMCDYVDPKTSLYPYYYYVIMRRAACADGA